MIYFKAQSRITSTQDVTWFGAPKHFKRVQWWQLLKPLDKIIYESYFHQSGNKSILIVLAVHDTCIDVKNDVAKKITIKQNELSRFSSLKDFKQRFPEEFI